MSQLRLMEKRGKKKKPDPISGFAGELLPPLWNLKGFDLLSSLLTSSRERNRVRFKKKTADSRGQRLPGPGEQKLKRRSEVKDPNPLQSVTAAPVRRHQFRHVSAKRSLMDSAGVGYCLSVDLAASIIKRELFRRRERGGGEPLLLLPDLITVNFTGNKVCWIHSAGDRSKWK